MTIKNKTELRKILYTENYDVIVFYEKDENLYWNQVTSGFDSWIDTNGEREYPLFKICRAQFYDVTHRAVSELLEQIENQYLFGEVDIYE